METTLLGYSGYEENGTPEFVRARMATQYANSIDEWVSIMQNGNNGGYANAWLIVCDLFNFLSIKGTILLFRETSRPMRSPILNRDSNISIL